MLRTEAAAQPGPCCDVFHSAMSKLTCRNMDEKDHVAVDLPL